MDECVYMFDLGDRAPWNFEIVSYLPGSLSPNPATLPDTMTKCTRKRLANICSLLMAKPYPRLKFRKGTRRILTRLNSTRGGVTRNMKTLTAGNVIYKDAFSARASFTLKKKKNRKTAELGRRGLRKTIEPRDRIKRSVPTVGRII